MLLAQVDVPKDGNMAAWFGYAVVILLSLTTGALGYLISNSRKKDADAEKLLTQLLDSMRRGEAKAEERVKEAEGRLTHAWAEHDKMNAATMEMAAATTHRADEIANSLTKLVTTSDANHKTVIDELRTVKDEIRKKRGPDATGSR